MTYIPGKQKSKKGRILVFIILLLLMLVVGILLSPIFSAENIEISGCKETNPEEIKNFLKNKNIFILTEFKVNRLLEKKFPQIQSAKTKRQAFKKNLQIEIQEREKAAIICRNPEPFKCFYIDKNGIIFADAPQTSGLLFLLIKDFRNKEFGFGQAVLKPEFVEELFNLKNDLQNLKIKITEFTIEENNDLKAVTSEGWHIIFDPKMDIKNQLLALEAGLKQVIKNTLNLEYIDLRIENRIYYK